MYTVCPNCSSVHPLQASSLARAGGKVRCLRCQETFDALDSLHDDYPDGRRPAARREAGSAPPELGRKPAPGFPAHAESAPASRQTRRQWPWALALVVLIAVTAANVLWTFREVIPRDGAVGRALESWSVPGFEARPAFRDPTRIHLLSRDVHAHPTLPGVLVLSASFTNLADQAQPYPDISVALKDPEGRVIAARRFDPPDYLVRAPESGALFGSGAQVPLLLEFADPGERATGFELRFH